MHDGYLSLQTNTQNM